MVFLISEARLNSSDKDYLKLEAVRTYLNNESSRKLKREDFEGEIVVGNYVTFGGISGVQFDAKLEHNTHGEVGVRFLGNCLVF